MAVSSEPDKGRSLFEAEVSNVSDLDDYRPSAEDRLSAPTLGALRGTATSDADRRRRAAEAKGRRRAGEASKRMAARAATADAICEAHPHLWTTADASGHRLIEWSASRREWAVVAPSELAAMMEQTGTIDRLSAHDVREIRAMIERRTTADARAIRLEPDRWHPLQAVEAEGEPPKPFGAGAMWANGYVATEGKQAALSGHPCESWSEARRVVPRPFDRSLADGEMPLWAAALRRWNIEGYEPLLLAWLGSALVGDSGHHRALWLVGPSRTGKSTLTRLMAMLVGPSAASVERVERLQGQFGAAKLVGAQALIVGDAERPCRRLEDAFGLLKAIVGADTLNVEAKHQPDRELAPRVSVMVASNYQPSMAHTIEEVGPWSERLIVVPMDQRLPPAERDSRLAERIATAEGDALANLAVAEWESWRASRYKVSAEHQAVTSRAVKSGLDPHIEWAATRLTADAASEIEANDLVIDFQCWAGSRCGDDGTISAASLKQYVAKALGAERIRATRDRPQRYRGIRFVAQPAERG